MNSLSNPCCSLARNLQNGSVRFHSYTENVWESTLTLKGGGLETYVPHEYAEFRWAELIGAPEPPTHDMIHGWQVHYAFDGELNEDGLVIQPPMSPPNPRAPPAGRRQLQQIAAPWATAKPARKKGMTDFGSSSAELDAVWKLVLHTINGAALDLNSDSNTRQRDLCSLDAYLATKYQGGVAPASSSHIRRKVTQIMWEPNGYVNVWTEFLIAHIGALYEYSLDYADATLAEAVWSNPPILAKVRGKNYSVDRDSYTLLKYFNQSDNQVYATPNPLIDWPRSGSIDTDGSSSKHCDKNCVQVNAYAALIQKWSGAILARMGKADEAAEYAKRAEAIRAATQALFATSECDVNSSSPVHIHAFRAAKS